MSSSSYERFVLATAPLDEGTVLLEASAGTGKTYTLTGILVRMVLEDVVVHIEQALLVTFTIAAADELKNRLRHALQRAHDVCLGGDDGDEFFNGLASFGKKGAVKLRLALDEFDQASVMTIHGFCKRLLDESAFESDEPFDLELAADEAPLMHAAAADALRLVRKHDSLMLGAVLHRAKIGPDELTLLYRNWQRYPGVLLAPAEPQLGVHLANLRAAVHRAAAQWDDELLNFVASLRWLSTHRPTGDLHEHFARLAEPLNGRPELCLALLNSLSPRSLKKTLYKKPPAKLDHPFFATCGEVQVEWELTLDHLRTDLMLRMHERLLRHKQERSILTYDDLLRRTHAAITDPKRQQALLHALHQRYAVALIDEFQDTDERQYGILSQCFRNRPLFLVGDPKQAIYSFRGADLRTYLRAAGDAIQKNTLTTNFRSSEPLVAAVNQLFARAGSFVEHKIRMHKVRAQAEQHELQIGHDDGAAMRFRFFPCEANDKGAIVLLSPDETRRRIAADVSAEVRRLLDGPASLDDGPILPRHIAILTRRNVEAVMMQEHLREAGVVSVIGKAGDIFDTEELVELERLLRAMQRPSDVMCARAALTTRLWGYDAAQLADLELDEGQLETERNRLEVWRQLWMHKGFVVMHQRLLQDLHVHARFLLHGDGERRLTNLQQLCEMLHQAEHDHRLSPEGLLNWLRHERTHRAETDYQRRELRLESDEDAVQILTMHGSKGLQYEIVFCPFLWDGRTAQTKNTVLEGPSPTNATTDRTTTGDEAHDQQGAGQRRFAFEVAATDPGWQRAEADRLAEDCRLAYVALTRAKRRCYVHWGPIGSYRAGYWCSALAWLLHPDGVDQHKQDWPVTWAKSYRNRSLGMHDDLQRIATHSNGAIGIDMVAEPSMAHALTREHNREPLASATGAGQVGDSPTDEAALTASRLLGRPAGRAALPSRQPLVVHSFSSLVAGGSPEGEAHDVRDPTKPTIVGAGEVGEQIFGFARGPKAGLCLHEILEHVDLHDLDSQATQTLVTNTLKQHSLLLAEAHPGALDPVPTVLQNLRDLAAASVHDAGPTVLEVCGGERIAEWKFTIPIARPDLRKLATCFAESGCEHATGYADRMRHLAPQRFAGFLTGFADLITQYDGRYWVVDWKSNHLGNNANDYGPDALWHAMQSHDYVLQYHLYVLAWHRHLRTRLPGYDYDTHFGGISYAFLRGAQPARSNGMFYSRPPHALIQAMDAWATGNAP